jgi:hypothetical protein
MGHRLVRRSRNKNRGKSTIQSPGTAKSAQRGTSQVRIYRNGQPKDTTNLDYRGTVIVPERGNAPFRVATRDRDSFFEGAIGKVAIYEKELSRTRVERHYRVMTKR